MARNRAQAAARRKLDDIQKLEEEKTKKTKKVKKGKLMKKFDTEYANSLEHDVATPQHPPLSPIPFPLERAESYGDEPRGVFIDDDGSPDLNSSGATPMTGGGGRVRSLALDANGSGVGDGIGTSAVFGLAPIADTHAHDSNPIDDAHQTELARQREQAIEARKRQERRAKRAARKIKQARRDAGQPVSDDDESVHESDFESEEEDMKYNRHDHITIDMPTSDANASLPGETSLALNPDYSNLVYDPAATAQAAAELAALTGQSLVEVQAMLAAQQQQELINGGAASLATMGAGAGTAMGMSMGMPIASPSMMGQQPLGYDPAASVTYTFDDIPPIVHTATRTYDDVMLGYHGPLESDPYLLSIYSPSHIAAPSLIPPTPPLHPRAMPYKPVDTHYSRPLPPAAWRLLHGHSPWGQTISFDISRHPRWWLYHKGVDVTESPTQLARVRRGARAVARRPKRVTSNKNNPSMNMPTLLKVLNARTKMKASIHPSRKKPISSLRATRLNPHDHSSTNSNSSSSAYPSHSSRADLHQLVRDEPLQSPSNSIYQSDYPLASPSTSGSVSRDSYSHGIGDLTDRHHSRGDEEERRSSPTSSYNDQNGQYTQRERERDSGPSMMGSSDGASTYRGYSSFMPMREEEKSYKHRGPPTQQLWRLDD